MNKKIKKIKSYHSLCQFFNKSLKVNSLIASLILELLQNFIHKSIFTVNSKGFSSLKDFLDENLVGS